MKKLFKKALVTGGAGFIGSHIIEELLREGLEVVSIDNYVVGKKENLSAFHSYTGFYEVDCDILDYNGLEKYFSGVDIVFHEATSKMTVCLQDPRKDLAVNAQGTFNILELSKKYGIKKIIHASTGSVYGEAKYYPTDEEHSLNPVSYYGISKLAAEKYVRIFNQIHGLDTTILRYYHVYGPRADSSDIGNVISIFARRAILNQPLIIYGDGSQLRSFTYVKDIVNINRLVAARKETRGEIYNCASGVKISILELAKKILAYYNKEDLQIQFKDWRTGDIKKFDVSNAKIRNLGYEFKTDFDHGLPQTLEWLKWYFKDKENLYV